MFDGEAHGESQGTWSASEETHYGLLLRVELEGDKEALLLGVLPGVYGMLGVNDVNCVKQCLLMAPCAVCGGFMGERGRLCVPLDQFAPEFGTSCSCEQEHAKMLKLMDSEEARRAGNNWYRYLLAQQ